MHITLMKIVMFAVERKLLEYDFLFDFTTYHTRTINAKITIAKRMNSEIQIFSHTK